MAQAISHPQQELESSQLQLQLSKAPRAAHVEEEVEHLDVGKSRSEGPPVLPLLPEEGEAYHDGVGRQLFLSAEASETAAHTKTDAASLAAVVACRSRVFRRLLACRAGRRTTMNARELNIL